MIRFEDENQHSIYMYDSSDLAKYIGIRHPITKKPIGRTKFIELLRFNGYVMKDSNQPTQLLVTMGLAVYHMVNRRYKKYGMLLFTERGMNYIKRKVEDGSIQIGFQKKVNKSYDCVKTIDDVL